MSYSNSIVGWMSGDELNFLYKSAKKMKSIVEIGSYKGRSTLALLEGCKGTVVAIDTWLGSPGLNMDGTEYDTFLENTKDYDNLEILKKDSVDAAENIDEVDMVFIDGEHTYEGVKRDIEAWLPKTKKLICGHDHDDEFPGIIKAVAEMIGEVDGVVDSIWYKYL